MSSRSKSDADTKEDICQKIVERLHQRADEKTRLWFTNYVKGTKWFGCKTPVVRDVVQKTVGKKPKDITVSPKVLIDCAIHMIQREECDAKLAGMILLDESLPKESLLKLAVLKRLERELLKKNHLNDWSSSDWFSMRVLQNYAFSGNHEHTNYILSFATNRSHSLWHRRCGIVPMVYYTKHREVLPSNFGEKLVHAIETNLKASPDERFTQTGCAWVLRGMLLEKAEKQLALDMILRNSSIWNKEAKKSITEKLGKKDPTRRKILNLEQTD